MFAAPWQCCSAVAQDQSGAGAPVCGGAAIADGTVKAITDARTFTLADNRDVRLAAIEVPALPLPGSADPKADRWGAAAKAALEALAGGDRVVLRAAQAVPDRY